MVEIVTLALALVLALRLAVGVSKVGVAVVFEGLEDIVIDPAGELGDEVRPPVALFVFVVLPPLASVGTAVPGIGDVDEFGLIIVDSVVRPLPGLVALEPVLRDTVPLPGLTEVDEFQPVNVAPVVGLGVEFVAVFPSLGTVPVAAPGFTVDDEFHPVNVPVAGLVVAFVDGPPELPASVDVAGSAEVEEFHPVNVDRVAALVLSVPWVAGLFDTVPP